MLRKAWVLPKGLVGGSDSPLEGSQAWASAGSWVHHFPGKGLGLRAWPTLMGGREAGGRLCLHRDCHDTGVSVGLRAGAWGGGAGVHIWRKETGGHREGVLLLCRA